MTGQPPPRSRRGLRLLAGLILLIAGSAGYLAWVSRAPVRDLIPGGAILVAELRDGNRTADRLAGTRFAREFARGRTAAWLERGGLLRAYDGLRAEVKSVTGIGITRRHLLDLVGEEAVVAWYPAADSRTGTPPPWLAGCRLSLRAWCVLSALRAAERWGVGDLHPPREEIAGREILSLPADDPLKPYRVFTVGRLLVVGNDRELVARAAGRAAGLGLAVSGEAAWAAVRAQLPPGEGLFLWGRPPQSAAAVGAYGAQLPPQAGLLLTPGAETEIHVFASRVTPPSPQGAVRAGPSFPGGGLRSRDPLFLHTRRGAPPPLVTELLTARVAAVARRDGTVAGEAPRLGEGFGLIVTDSVGTGPFPLPRGVVLVGMESPAAAADTIRRLFPAGARIMQLAGMTAYSTRESLPLAGSFDLWAAAADRFLLFASDTALLEEAARTVAAGDPAGGRDGPGASLGANWRTEAYTALSAEKAMPFARRYAPVFSGWLLARFRDAPDIGRDVELLRAVRSATVTTGTGAEGSLARIRLTLADL